MKKRLLESIVQVVAYKSTCITYYNNIFSFGLFLVLVTQISMPWRRLFSVSNIITET